MFEHSLRRHDFPALARRTRVLSRALALIAVLAVAPRAFAQTVVVVVNKQNPVENVSWQDLVKVFRMEKQTWNNGSRIALATRAGESKERDKVDSLVYGMTEAQLKTFWVQKIFRGEVPSPPVAYDANEKVLKAVAGSPGGIGYVDASALDSSVKPLAIDGVRWQDAGYKLR